MGVISYKWHPIVNKQVAVVVERNRYLDQEAEQYGNCRSKIHFKYR